MTSSRIIDQHNTGLNRPKEMVTSIIDPDTLASPLAQTYLYWQKIQASRTLPLASDFDPIAIPQALAHLILVGIEQSPLDFRFRVIGDYINERMKTNYMHQCLSDIPEKGPSSQIWAFYERCWSEKKPVLVRLNYIGPYAGIRQSEEIYLPLGNEAGEVTKILVCLTFDAQGIPPR
ncbi:PAS domain-containing protein [Aestuariispira insulae]|uniref:PAS domain-containing protein n=1 Tax=Aestuariispira insulae TaxID=1461337 RepID=A0A3D9HE28_9PROT|nr:PAS domain-containing protein [Aestuariispira insulae]RED47724.1 PAS domain-containing protein [Aestuariispira insulae]